MRPCPGCGERRQSALLELGEDVGCGSCGLVYPRQAAQPQGATVIRPGVRVVARGTSTGRPVRPGVCR